MGKLDNSGFTLIELLAVIVILIIITSIAIPSISSSIERTNETQEKGKNKLLNTAVELYLSDHKSYREAFYNSDSQNRCYILVSDLIPNYIEKDDIVDSNGNIPNYIYYYDDEVGFFDQLGENGYTKCQ